MKIPNTPFSTRLSGSARETELRLRSIFQWKKKRPPVIVLVLAAVLLLGICGGLVGFRSTPSNGTFAEIYPEYFAEGAIVEIIYVDKADEGPSEPIPGSDEYAASMEYLRDVKLRAAWGHRRYIGDYDYRNGSFWLVNENDIPLKIELYPDDYIVVSTGWGQTEGHSEAKVYRAESFDKETFLMLWVPLKDDTPEPELSQKLDMTTVTPISGMALSPDGAYEVRLNGVIEGVSTDDLAAAEFVQICDTQTGNVLWQGDGAYEHAVVWSTDSKKIALARTTRTGSTVTIVETERWTAWNATIPGTDYWNQVPIPEYTYLPDNGDWLDWVNISEFRLTLGRGGDAGEKTDYHVILSGGFPLNGSALFMESELLSTEYDLDHDGSPERLERMFVRESEDGPVSFFKLHVLEKDGILLWSGEAHTAHAGWNTYFVCTLDGQDYLLEYDPYMSGGVAYYSYRLFYLGPNGEEVLYRENSLEFDINPASKFMNHNFDADAIADFVDEVNELLVHSKLMMTTDDAVRDMDPDAPTETLWWLEYPYGYDESKSLREKLKDMELYLLAI